MSDRYAVIVVGAGQAGLAMGHFLAQQGERFTILEAAEGPGPPGDRAGIRSSCSPRSATTAFGASVSRSPGQLPGEGSGRRLSRRLRGPFRVADSVQQPGPVNPQGDHGYLVELDERSYEADQVVVATGPFQVPIVPAIADRLAPEVVQFHGSDYRAPERVPAGRVLVVGAGNTGYQIAQELSGSHEVHLSVGSRQTPLPQRILGRDLFRVLDATGVMTKTRESRIGRRLDCLPVDLVCGCLV